MNPTTEKKWIDDFILELRLREVRGDAIGDAVASVRELLADTGQEPEQAFGTPREYAAQLELPLVASPGIAPASILPSAIGVLALLAYSSAVWAFFEGRELAYSLPQVLLLAVPVALVSALPWSINWLLRNLWGLAALMGLFTAVAFASAFLKPGAGSAPWLQIDALLATVVSGAVLLAMAVWGTVETARTPDDPIVDPHAAPKQARKTNHVLASALPHALMPFCALASTLAAWLMTR